MGVNCEIQMLMKFWREEDIFERAGLSCFAS